MIARPPSAAPSSIAALVSCESPAASRSFPMKSFSVSARHMILPPRSASFSDSGVDFGDIYDSKQWQKASVAVLAVYLLFRVERYRGSRNAAYGRTAGSVNDFFFPA